MEPFGRDAEIAEIRALLEAGGTVQLTGPAGIGKSTLARALGAGVVVELASVDGPLERQVDGLQAQLARALSCPADRPAAVSEALADVPLVVLDDAGGVGDALAERLPGLARMTAVLVVTRHRLQLPDAVVFELGPLAPEAGRALLEARLASVRQRSRLDPAALEALSVALDGVPLALELAAPQLRIHSPEALRERADAVLREGPGGDALREAIRESVAAVDQRAREVLSMAAVLPAPFDARLLAEATGAVVDRSLLELLDAGLVHPVPATPPRFRVLAPIRALVEPIPEDLSEVARRIAVNRLPELESAPLDARLGRLEENRSLLEWLFERGERQVKLRASLLLAAVDQRKGPVTDILRRHDLLGAAPPDGDRGLEVRWAHQVAGVACHLDLPDLAEAVLAAVEPLLGDDSDRATWLSLQAMRHVSCRESEPALRCSEQALALSADDPWVWFRRGVVLVELRRWDEAADAFRRARAIEDPFRKAQATYSMGLCLSQAGRPAEVVLAELDASPVDDLPEWTWLVPRFTFLRAYLAAGQGDFEAAREGFFRASDQSRRLGELDDALSMWLNAHSIGFLEGVPVEILERAVPDDPFSAAQLRVWCALVHAALGHASAAEALGVPAIRQLAANDNPQHDDLAPFLAVALGPSHPALAREVLATAAPGRLRDRAEAALRGDPTEPPVGLEASVLDGIRARVARRARVRSDGGAFELGGDRTDISGRRVLRRVLEALAREGEPPDVSAICAAAWPDQKLVGNSGTRRVHVAISSLRKLGLDEAIVTSTDDAGTTRWRLEADVVEGL